MKAQLFENILKEDINVIRELSLQSTNTEEIDCSPSKITLNSIVTISQKLDDNKVNTYDFEVIEIWLKPNNMFTVVNVAKEKVEKNYWILFYTDGCFYIKKGIKGPICVHCTLKGE